MKTAIRQMGNSRGVIIPKALLAQAGLVDEADIVLVDNVITLRKPAVERRVGWAESAQRISQARDDALVMGEFANADDKDLRW
jgi:antitoxin MazE